MKQSRIMDNGGISRIESHGCKSPRTQEVEQLRARILGFSNTSYNNPFVSFFVAINNQRQSLPSVSSTRILNDERPIFSSIATSFYVDRHHRRIKRDSSRIVRTIRRQFAQAGCRVVRV